MVRKSPLVFGQATHTNTKLSICRVQWDVLGHTVGQWAGVQLGHLWHRTGPAALPAVGNSGAWGGTALHPRLWAPVSVQSLSGVPPGLRFCCSKVEAVWTMSSNIWDGFPGQRACSEEKIWCWTAMLGLSCTLREHARLCCLHCDPHGGSVGMAHTTPGTGTGSPH